MEEKEKTLRAGSVGARVAARGRAPLEGQTRGEPERAGATRRETRTQKQRLRDRGRPRVHQPAPRRARDHARKGEPGALAIAVATPVRPGAVGASTADQTRPASP